MVKLILASISDFGWVLIIEKAIQYESFFIRLDEKRYIFRGKKYILFEQLVLTNCAICFTCTISNFILQKNPSHPSLFDVVCTLSDRYRSCGGEYPSLFIRYLSLFVRYPSLFIRYLSLFVSPGRIILHPRCFWGFISCIKNRINYPDCVLHNVFPKGLFHLVLKLL